MPYDIRIISSTEFLRLDAQGHLDLAASRQMLYDTLWACTNRSIGRVLIDTRQATTDMTAAQVTTLADTCRQVTAPADQHKIAILNRPVDEFDRAAVVAEAAEEQGWNVRTFRTFESAFQWLAC